MMSNNRLAVLAEDIRQSHLILKEGAEALAELAIETGHKLIECKNTLPHGEFQPWLADHIGISPRTARRYMQLARSGLKAATVAVLGVRATTEAVGHRRVRAEPDFPLPGSGQVMELRSSSQTAIVWRDASEAFNIMLYFGPSPTVSIQAGGTAVLLPGTCNSVLAELWLRLSGFDPPGALRFRPRHDEEIRWAEQFRWQPPAIDEAQERALYARLATVSKADFERGLAAVKVRGLEITTEAILAHVDAR